jgi:sn-glycerol 3-phosphate transport system permease protein
MVSIPILAGVLAAVVGAVAVGIIYARFHRPAALGAGIGAMAGAVGSMLFMVPLNYCTFAPDRTSLDAAVGVFLIAVGTAAAVYGVSWLSRWRFERRFRATQNIGAASSSGLFRSRVTPWLLLAPTLVILVLFLYYPSLDTVRVSTLLRFVGINRTRFVCVDNFTTMLGDPDYVQTLIVSFVIAGAVVVLGLILSLLIATAAYQPITGGNFYRTLLIWPYAISPAVAGIIFSLLFDPISGGLNAVLERVIGYKLPLLNDPAQATIAVVLASVWKTMGFGILFYVAGLQNIPNDLKEAASIDGANVVQRFFSITVPLLSPITFFLIITLMSYAFFDIFGTIDLLTTGGPSSATTVMMYKIYRTGSSDLGLASAQSIVLFLVVIAMTGIQFITTGRRVNYGA